MKRMPIASDVATREDVATPGEDDESYDTLSFELPLEAPAPGLAADFVVDLTQL